MNRRMCKCGYTIFNSPFSDCGFCGKCGTNYKRVKAHEHREVIFNHTVGGDVPYKHCTKCNTYIMGENEWEV